MPLTMPLFDLQQTLDQLETAPSDAVVATLRGVTERMPMHLPAYVLLARALERRAQWAEALTVWQRAHVLMPNSPVISAGIDRALQRRESSDADSSSADQSSADQSSADDASASALPEPLAASFAPDARATSSLPDAAQLAPDEDLDHLIQELESARIQPDPDLDAIPEPDLDDDIEDMVSETLARIYTAQEQYGEAARVYMKLAAQEPARAQEFLDKASELEARAKDQAED